MNPTKPFKKMQDDFLNPQTQGDPQYDILNPRGDSEMVRE
jgi:hypothetical protein